jgi:hypothetical protein
MFPMKIMMGRTTSLSRFMTELNLARTAKVSIKIENNEKLGRDLPQNDKQPEESSQSPTNTNEQ